MMRTNLTYDDVRGHEEELVDALFEAIPSGLGGGGVHEGTIDDVEAILSRGMDWALEAGYAVQDDLEHCEDEGYRPEGNPDKVSEKARNRGRTRSGRWARATHFLEVQRVTDVFRDDVAADFGLTEDQIVVLIHCGLPRPGPPGVYRLPPEDRAGPLWAPGSASGQGTRSGARRLPASPRTTTRRCVRPSTTPG